MDWRPSAWFRSEYARMRRELMPPVNSNFVLRINVEIDQEYSGSGSLRISETIPFCADSFSALCAVLARFDALAQEIKKHAPPIK